MGAGTDCFSFSRSSCSRTGLPSGAVTFAGSVGRSGEPATMKQMGALVKAVSAKAEGRAEGKEIAALVRAKLQG